MNEEDVLFIIAVIVVLVFGIAIGVFAKECPKCSSACQSDLYLSLWKTEANFYKTHSEQLEEYTQWCNKVLAEGLQNTCELRLTSCLLNSTIAEIKQGELK